MAPLPATIAATLLLCPGSLQAQAACAQEQLRSHQAHYCLYGEGGPTIVLGAGAGLTARTWDDLAPRLAEFGTVLTFDRAGLGRSSAALHAPRTPRRLASELQELLTILDLPAPYILVGHSAGGWQMLRLVEQFPEDVAGVVLLDTPPPTFETRRNDLLGEDERQARRDALARGAASAPAVVRQERSDARPDVDSGFPKLRDHVSLVVVTANAQNFGSVRHEDALRDTWVTLSRGWLKLSDSGRFIVARGAGHMIHHERPRLIAEVVRSLLLE